MLRDKLSKIISSRVFLIIFALLAAVALWMYVEITINEESSHELTAVPIVFRNEAILRDRGLWIASREPQTVRLEFEVSRQVASQLTNNTVSVEIDLANIARTGYVSEVYDIIFPAGVGRLTPISSSVDRITLFVDQVAVRTIPVRSEYVGGLAAEDLIAEPVVVEPPTITIEGPEGVISRVSHAMVPIFRENLSTTITDELPFILIDEYGHEIEAEFLDVVTTNTDLIRVTVPIRLVKEIPLDIALSHGAGSSEQNTSWSIEPAFITVSGDAEALRDINTLVLNTIDMTSFTSSTTQSFPIVLPSHIQNDSGVSTATVFISVHDLDFEDFAVDNLFVNNLLPGHSIEMITRSIDVRIRGRRDDLYGISETDIRVVADLRDILTEPLDSPDRFRVPARIYIDGVSAGVGPIGEYRINLRVIPDSYIAESVNAPVADS